MKTDTESNFCSSLSSVSGEPLAGTATVARGYIFLPVPKALWGAKEFNSSWASAELLELIRHAKRSGLITRLYNPSDGPDPIALAFHPPLETPDGSVMERFSSFYSVRVNDHAAAFICTHGTRDRCCAKWGFATYRAARSAYDEGSSSIRPYEASHLGGDRLAATAIIFPSGSMYGRLNSASVTQVLAAEAEGRLEAANYRGRAFEAQQQQLARLALARIEPAGSAARRIHVKTLDETSVLTKVQADSPDLPAPTIIQLERATFKFFSSCKAASTGTESETTRWILSIN